jgi:hypothetical protein
LISKHPKSDLTTNFRSIISRFIIVLQKKGVTETRFSVAGVAWQVGIIALSIYVLTQNVQN